jgi:ribose transport system permease protein
MSTDTTPRAAAERRPFRERIADVEQGVLVIGLSVVMCVVGALLLNGFATSGNFETLLRQSAAFGILALAQSVVILGKGIDLSIAGVALGCGQATVALADAGMPEGQAIILMSLVAVGVGLINGYLIAYVDVPALFVTLATGMLVVGGVSIFILKANYYALPANSALLRFARGTVFMVPRPIIIAAAAFVLVGLALRYTSAGKLIRAMGDNFESARSMGAPVRPLQVLTYVVSALLALLAGYLTISIQGSVQAATSAFHPLLFTALTVAVIGGVSLAGGRGSIFGVLAGTVFVAILNNVLILLNLSAPAQDLTRGLVLIGAIFLDAWLHPRDEETAKSGDL